MTDAELKLWDDPLYRKAWLIIIRQRRRYDVDPMTMFELRQLAHRMQDRQQWIDLNEYQPD